MGRVARGVAGKSPQGDFVVSVCAVLLKAPKDIVVSEKDLAKNDGWQLSSDKARRSVSII